MTWILLDRKTCPGGLDTDEKILGVNLVMLGKVEVFLGHQYTFCRHGEFEFPSR